MLVPRPAGSAWSWHQRAAAQAPSSRSAEAGSAAWIARPASVSSSTTASPAAEAACRAISASNSNSVGAAANLRLKAAMRRNPSMRDWPPLASRRSFPARPPVSTATRVNTASAIRSLGLPMVSEPTGGMKAMSQARKPSAAVNSARPRPRRLAAVTTRARNTIPIASPGTRPSSIRPAAVTTATDAAATAQDAYGSGATTLTRLRGALTTGTTCSA